MDPPLPARRNTTTTQQIATRPQILPITEFDSDDFILHYWAARYNIPYRFLEIINPQNKPIRNLRDRQEIFTKLDLFQDLFSRGADFDTISSELSLNETDSIALYTWQLLDVRNKREALLGLPKIEDPDEGILSELNKSVGKRRQRQLIPLQSMYRTWWVEYVKNRDIHRNNIIRLNDIRDIISNKAQYLPKSPLSITKVTILGRPVWSSRIQNTNRKNISSQDGLDIFNTSIVSSGLPYIELYTIGGQQIKRTSGRKFGTQRDIDRNESIRKESQKSTYKIYYLGESKMSVDYSKMIRASSENKITKNIPPNQIKMTVWGGVGDMSSAPKDSFLSATYNLDTNNLKVTISKISKRWRTLPGESSSQLISPNRGGTAEIVQSRILSALPSITVNRWFKTKINGHFKIFYLEIDKIGLLDLILLDDRFRAYFYVDEQRTPGAAKHKLYLHFGSILRVVGIEPNFNQAKIKMSFSQETTKPSQIYKVKLPNGQIVIREFPTGTPYVEFSLLNAPDLQEAERVINTVSKLFEFYMNHPAEKPIRVVKIDDYNGVIPGLAGIRKSLKPTSMDIPSIHKKQQWELSGKLDQTSKSDPTSKLALLKGTAPGVFVAGYATICQRAEQPIPIKIDEIPDWVDKTFLHDNLERERQVLRFPPINQVNADPLLNFQWAFVCPNDDIPFPGVKKNSTGNSDKYPYVPCCYTKDHMGESANSDYNKYYFGVPTKSIQTKAQQYINKTFKILEPGVFGDLPKTISEFLAVNDEQGTIYQVMGMPNTPNSLLDCILTATGDTKYIRKISIRDKAEYAMRYRKMLGLYFETGKFVTELLKQELYDQSSGQIISGLTNTSVFMDPALYYRMLEEIFKINIFVFTTKQCNSKNSKKFNQIEIPRHRNFYVRTHRPNRPTVLIYKHQVVKHKGRVITPAQCELIKRKQNNVYLYRPDSDAGTISSLFTLFYQTTAATEWLIDSDVSGGQRQVIKMNILNHVDFLPFVPKGSITYQILDDYGKLRGLVFLYSLLPTEARRPIIIITPPGQPINYPNWEGGEVPDPELVIKFFSGNKAAGASYIDFQNKSIDGLWYSIYGRQFGIYCPVRPVISVKSYPIGPDSPLNLSSYIAKRGLVVRTSLSRVDRIRGLRKVNNMILNIIKWLFSISRKTHNMTANNFTLTYLKSGPRLRRKSFSIYNLSRVPHRFPIVRNVNEAILWLSKITRGLVQEGRIYLYSQKYYSSISYFLRNYEKNTDGLEIEIPVIIPGRLMDVDDFIANPDNLIFMNQNELINWLNSVNRDQEKNTEIMRTINKTMMASVHPYIFVDTKNIYYLIQSAFPGKTKTIISKKKLPKRSIKTSLMITILPPESQQTVVPLNIVSSASTLVIRPSQPTIPKEGLLRALKIAETWKISNINLGYYSGIIDASRALPPYILYSISNSKIPVMKEDNSRGDPNLLIIIEYSKESFAAMLPL